MHHSQGKAQQECRQKRGTERHGLKKAKPSCEGRRKFDYDGSLIEGDFEAARTSEVSTPGFLQNGPVGTAKEFNHRFRLQLRSMTLASLNHRSFVESLNGLDNWLSSKGVPPCSTDRIHKLLRIVRAHDPRLLGPVVKMTSEEQRQYMFALAELLEFHQIAEWLHEDDPTILRPKLIRALSGSVDPSEETVENNVGRNTMFELSLAAEWRRAGLDVQIGEPDIQLTVGKQVFFVECKRPFAWTGIVRSLTDARRQLRRNGASHAPNAPKGIIAISLNRVLSAGQRVFFTESLADKTKVGDLINDELELNRWRWFETVQFDESMAAVVFHLNLPTGVTEGQQFALMSSLNGYKASANEEALAVFRQAMSYGLPAQT